jgi:hypothetical protein
MALQVDFENVVRMAGMIPTRESESFFAINWEFESLRERLAARLVEVRSQSAEVSHLAHT